MKSERALASLILFFLLTNMLSCITEFDPQLTNDVPKLVVDGMITDQPGPYVVRITYSAAYNNDETIFGRSPADARVAIHDDAGNVEVLRYTSNGYFASSATGMRGVAGRKYHISVLLANGKRYESQEERLAPTSAIDSVYAEYEELTGIFRGNFKIYLDASDPGDEENFYRWSWAHYEVRTTCKVTYDPPPPGGDGIPPIRVEWSCCDSCWTIARCEGCINISSDKFVNGRKIVKQYVTEVPYKYNSLTPYFILVQQQSLTRGAYEFWNKARGQLSNSGGVFDTPPVPIQGNLFNADDPDEQVLGYFGASAVRYRPYYLNRLIPGIPPNDHAPGEGPKRSCKPCEESYLTTGVRPIGWKD